MSVARTTFQIAVYAGGVRLTSFFDVTPCSMIERYWRFGGTCLAYLQCSYISSPIGAATPFKKLGGAHQNTRRLMPEELLVRTIKTTSAQALSLKCQPSIFWLFYKILAHYPSAGFFISFNARLHIHKNDKFDSTLFSHSYRASWYYQSFIYSPTDALVSCLKNNIKIYIKTAPTYFGVTVTPSSGSSLICAY